MLILICGDRNWSDFRPIQRELKRFDPEVDIIMEGEARGADQISAICAKCMGWPETSIIRVPADWGRYGRAAGPIRNQEMLDKNPDLVLAFHPNIADSKGTGDMVRRARAKGVPVEVFDK